MSRQVQMRCGVLVLVTALLFLLLAAQLGNLQLVQESRLVQRAIEQRTRPVPMAAPRGAIFDRTGAPLATNRIAWSVLIRYPHYREADVLTRTSAILGLSLAELQARVERRLRDQLYWEPVLVKYDVTPAEATAIAEDQGDLPGVVVAPLTVRDYPQGPLAAHLLGYVGPINPEELARWAEGGYRPGDTVGKSGLELQYEPYLRGQDGVRYVEVDHLFQPHGELGQPVAAVPGNDLVLTIDGRLQRAAERALDWVTWHTANLPDWEGVRWRNARAGAVVVVEVETGAILAMASRPAFDPSRFAVGISATAFAELNADPEAPLWHRAVAAAYHPGSAWKMVTGAAALGSRAVTPQEQVYSGGVYQLTGQRDWQAHGWVDLVRALQVSSDIYFYELGRRVGIDNLVSYARAFGFGRATGVDLPAENPGLLPDEGYRQQRAAQGQPWQLGETTSAAIGQIVQVTPLQLARYAAALANGGRLLRPYLVARITDPAGRELARFGPQQVGGVSVNPADLAWLVRGMVAVDSPGGTSSFAVWPLPGVRTAGKTGTAENPPRDDYGVYVGFAPAERPSIAVAAVIEQGGHGATVAGVARAVLAAYFGVELPPADPARVPVAFPARQAEILAVLRQGGVWQE